MNASNIIITGAAGALGSALTRRFASAGTTVVMLDKEERALERLYDDVVESGFAEPVIHPFDLSVAGPDDVSALLNSVLQELGGLDALVHCAARFEGLTPLEQFDAEEWLAQIQVNLNAAWLLSSLSLPLLRQAENGQLVFLLEDLDRVRKANWGAYGVSKIALSAMVSQLATEAGSTGVTILGINPGPFQSSLRSEAYISEDPATQRPPQEVAERLFDYLADSTSRSNPLVDLFAS